MATEQRLIDANALAVDLELLAKHEDDFRQSVILGVVHTVRNRPTVDAVEVCKCKDCQYGCKLWFDDKGVSFCRKIGIDIKPDHFCSYGERRTDDGKAD